MIKVINPSCIDLLEADSIASDVMQLLTPHCERINVAGSIRRRERYVGDIEIICLPKRTDAEIRPKVIDAGSSLFGDEPEIKQQLQQKIIKGKPVQSFIDIVNRWQKIKGEPTGRYTQRCLPNGCKLDLFMPTNQDYFRQYAIRTGSKDYSHLVIARCWRRRGWCGTEDGLRLIAECVSKNNTWKCLAYNPTLPPEWESEKDFFNFIGLTYMPPQFRNMTNLEKQKIKKQY